MVTMIPGSFKNEYYGLSTDDKPYTYVPNGSKFNELDTSAEYLFDAQNRRWVKQAKVSGGSGGSEQTQGEGTRANISLPGAWTGNDPYTQPVTITGYTVTANTRADIVQSDAIIEQMLSDGVDTIYIENDNGIFTAYAIGGRPSTAYDLTIVLTEV